MDVKTEQADTKWVLFDDMIALLFADFNAVKYDLLRFFRSAILNGVL